VRTGGESSLRNPPPAASDYMRADVRCHAELGLRQSELSVVVSMWTTALRSPEDVVASNTPIQAGSMRTPYTRGETCHWELRRRLRSDDYEWAGRLPAACKHVQVLIQRLECRAVACGPKVARRPTDDTPMWASDGKPRTRTSESFRLALDGVPRPEVTRSGTSPADTGAAAGDRARLWSDLGTCDCISCPQLRGGTAPARDL